MIRTLLQVINCYINTGTAEHFPYWGGGGGGGSAGFQQYPTHLSHFNIFYINVECCPSVAF